MRLRSNAWSALLVSSVALAACSSDDGGETKGNTGGASGGGGTGAQPAGGAGGVTGGAGGAGGATGGASGGGGSPAGGAGGSGGGPSSTDCALPNVRCVDDAPGPTQEYSTIQAAADASAAGDTVVVHPGAYAGFQVDPSGAAGSPIYFFANGAGVKITSPASTGDGIRLQNVSHVVIDGFEIEAPPQRCIAARGATPEAPMIDVTVRRNLCKNATVEGFYLSEVSKSLIEDNEVSGAGVKGDTRSHCIYLANAGSDDTTIRRNRLHGCKAAESNGIHMNGDLSVGGDGIISGLVVESNVIYDNGQNGLNLDGVQSSLFQNNVIYGNARNGLRAYAIDGAAGPKGLRVVNNTLRAEQSGFALKLSEDEGGHVVFGNVLLGSSGAISMDASPGFQSNYNAVSDQLSADGESSMLGLAGWQALGFDKNSFVASAALFTNAAAGDYTLAAGAPAIDKGTATFGGINAPVTDFLGTSRPQGAGFDIGAHERKP